MTLDRLRPATERFLAPCVRLANRLGLTPDTVSVIAFLLAIAAGVAFYLGDRWYVLGAGLVFLNGWLDLVDGELARELGVDSPRGDLLDHVLDRYADIALIAGLAAGTGRYAIGFAAVTGVLMTSYLGTQAIAVGLERVYGGLMGRADRLVLIGIVATLAPFLPSIGPLSVVGWLLVVFAVVGHLTAGQRLYDSLRGL